MFEWVFVMVTFHVGSASMGADTYATKEECLQNFNVAELAQNAAGWDSQVPGAAFMKCIYTDKSVQEVFDEIDNQAAFSYWR